MAEHYIYKTTNTINGKYYYGKRSCKGSAIDDPYMGSGKLLKTSIKKYGIENFTKEILAYCDSSEDAYELEELVVTQKEVNDPMCYNIVVGGVIGMINMVGEKNGMYNKKHTQESRKKMSESSKGKTHTEITKKKLSDIRKGIPKSEEHKRKISCSKLGTKYENCNREYVKGKFRIHDYNGKLYTIKELANISNIKPDTIYYRIKNGWDIEDAINTPVCKYKGVING